ncbi:UNVERIFIED_CONTAM: ABC transporter G family member 28 [Sesamum calycinum]|uniref:ABC transporter G family member 28 n=1 Tax=Sesamum calycinum TaxID=2727403 RepID=A0AAW2KPC9_9LAMI
MSIRFILPASNVQYIFTSYLLEGQIILVEELIFGQMLAEAVQCSVLQDHIVQQTHKKFLVPAGITAAWALQLKHVSPFSKCDQLHLVWLVLVLSYSFYNCYEQVITLRERRYARSREVAVKSVKENAQAQARWLAAKDAIKKRAIEMSHSFSRRNVVQPGVQRGATSGRMEIESGHPSLQDNDEYSNSLKIFRYAYSQLEKEKAEQQQNRDLSFSAAVSMAINSETRSRPTIEIAFRDLMVTLKQKKKHLLRSVTGEIRPDLAKADKVLVVERVIESLGLQPVRDYLVGTVENSSSQLLLRALKREALEGVNICMVVHQPRFDDLILLAKGGLTVYHGAVKDVEDYFAQLGLVVPERINPPDYFIDVLEGMVKPSTSSGVTYEELPLRWMLHKGYPVPPDMQNNLSAVGMPAMYACPGNQENYSGSGSEQLSFWGKFWQNLKYKVEARYDVLWNNFLKSKDLSSRRTPRILQQYKYFLASLSLSRFEQLAVQNCGSENICPGQVRYRRERASGISSLAHFVAKDTIDHFNTLIKPLVYLSMFYFFSNPRSLFLDNYIVLLCLVYCVTGVAYALAIFLEPGPSHLYLYEDFDKLCYPSWALEPFIVSNAKRYYGVWLIQRCGALLITGYNLHQWNLCISLLLAAGAACRILAFVVSFLPVCTGLIRLSCRVNRDMNASFLSKCQDDNRRSIDVLPVM